MPTQSIPKLILDTDPGGDDILALLWLLSLVRQGLAELVAITTVEGNVAASRTFTSTSQVLALTGFSPLPVGRGVPLLQGEGTDAAHIHGTDGMGNLSPTLPPPTHPFETAPCSDDLIVHHLNQAPGEITIIAIGPLTNLAAAAAKQPGILQKAKEIVIMAGAFHCPGNVTSHAEFNVWCNPEAAQVVFNSRNDLVVLPLDVTRQLIFTRDMAQAVTRADPTGQLAQFLVKLCEFMIGTTLKHRETARIPGFLVHDAATLGYLFYPETFMLQRTTVRIETQGEWTRGQTLIDDRHGAKGSANAWVALQVDEAGFFASFLEDLQHLIAVSSP